MTLPPINREKRGRDGRLRSPRHLAFIRKRLCIAWSFGVCSGKVEACHVRDVAPYGHGGAKPDDTFTVGLCRKHHQESEKREGAWGRENGIDVLALAIEYALASPDLLIKDAAKAYLAAQKGAAE